MNIEPKKDSQKIKINAIINNEVKDYGNDPFFY
jgi:hypothetical protein